MHADPDRSRIGADDRPDLIEPEPRAVAQREQMLLLRSKETDYGAQLRRPFAGEKLLLEVRLGTCGFERERLHSRPTVNVAYRVPCDLEQPTRETAVSAKTREHVGRFRS